MDWQPQQLGLPSSNWSRQRLAGWLVKEGLAAGRLWLTRRQRMSWADAAISDIRRTGNLALSRGNYAKVSDVEVVVGVLVRDREWVGG